MKNKIIKEIDLTHLVDDYIDTIREIDRKYNNYFYTHEGKDYQFSSLEQFLDDNKEIILKYYEETKE